jgi:dipeptidyl-peptidase-4
MKRLSLLILFIAFGLIAFGQQKTINLEDVFKSRKLFPTNLSQLSWRSNSLFSYTANNSLVSANVKNAKVDTVVNLITLNENLKTLKLQELTALPKLGWKDEKTIYFFYKLRLFNFDVKTKKLQQITLTYDKSSNYEYDPQLSKIAYTREDNNVFVSENGNNYQVTFDGGNGIVNGEKVHRNEWGIDKGLFWSPKSNFLAYYRMDESMVTQYPLVDINKRVAAVDYIRYPMAGMKSHQVTIGVYNNTSGKSVFLQTGEPKEQFLTNITWSPDEQSVYVFVLNRLQNHLKVNQYDALTGMLIKTLFEEKNSRYVEPQNGMFFLNKDPSKFICLSQRNGWNHLFLMETTSQTVRQLTFGNWVVKDFIGIDSKDEFVYFTANKESPIQTGLYSLELKTGLITCISKEEGTHDGLFSPDYSFVIDRFSNLKKSNKIDLLTTKGVLLRNLIDSPDPFKDYTLGETSVFTIKNKQNTDLYCRLIKPANFDSKKKYPVLIYVYGGPHSQLVTNSWLGGAGHFLNYMAQKGYVIFTLDNRGTANRGFEFESCIHRQVGVLEMEDQLEGVKYLKSQPFVDSTRIGLDGWSYGGFMTLTMLLKNPGMFKDATCGGPVVDWKWYEIMYGERYMDRTDENADGYEKSSVLNYVDSLNAPLLIFQGAQDNTVLCQHSQSFVEKCIKAGKLVDYFIFPNHEHNVRGIDRVYLWRKIEQFHEQNLKN